jgi:hypothetical protein
LTLQAAVTCAGTNGVIDIPVYAVPTLTGNVTIPSGVTLHFWGSAPGQIKLGNFNLTINGPIQAPAAQVFVYSGTGTVTFGNGAGPILANWFGCNASGLNNAITSFTSAGGIVDARACPSMTGQNVTVNVGSNTQQVSLLLPAATYSGTADPLFIVSNGSALTTAMGTAIQQTCVTCNGIILAGKFPGNTISPYRGGIYGLGTIQGPTATAASTSGSGIVWGGGTEPGNIVGNNAIETELEGIAVHGFTIGVKYGDNNYLTLMNHVRIYDNTSNVIEPSTLSGSGESLQILDSVFANNPSTGGTYTACVKFNDTTGSTHVQIIGGSMDECQYWGAGNVTTFISKTHFENPNCSTDPTSKANPPITINGSMSLAEALILEDCGSETKTAEVYNTGAGNVTVVNTTSAGPQAFPSFLKLSGAGNGMVVNLLSYGNVQSMCASSSTGVCTSFSNSGDGPKLQLGLTTVSSLPSAATYSGYMMAVSDSTLGSEGAACVGGGSTRAFAWSNGSIWKCF